MFVKIMDDLTNLEIVQTTNKLDAIINLTDLIKSLKRICYTF